MSTLASVRRVRILFTTDCYYPHQGGGTEVVVRQLAEGLANLGHEVHVATLNTRSAEEYSLLDKVHVHRFPTLDLTGCLRLQLTFSAAFTARFGGLLDSVRPDVVNAHNVFFSTTPVALLEARRRAIPTVLTLHLNAPTGLGVVAATVASLYERTIGRISADSASQIVAVGPSVATHAHRTWKLPMAPAVIPNGVDAEKFHPAEAPPTKTRILFVGRLVPNKGPHIFVAAARSLLAVGRDVEFQIAGNGPMRAELEAQAGGDPRIRFLGERSDVADLMRSATVFVRPSTLEGFPLTVLEAMASGLPTVASAIPGNVDLVEPHRTGLLCGPESPASLADCLTELIEHPELSSEMGREARRRVVDGYTWEKAVDHLEALLLTLLQGYQPRGRRCQSVLA